MVWYLPAILLDARKVCILIDTVKVINSMTQNAIWQHFKLLNTVLKINAKSKNWRIGPMHYSVPVDVMRESGTVSMSPGWFQQGHEVSGHPSAFAAVIH